MPTAQASGLPAKVWPWANCTPASGGPKNASAMSSRAIIAPSGITPFEMPFPEQMMSGVTPKVCAANMRPVLANPVITSSKISITLWRSQTLRMIWKYSSVGVMMPPVLPIGSTMTPATVSGSSPMMTSSNALGGEAVGLFPGGEAVAIVARRERP